MIQQLFTISRHTFIESIRQPIYTVLILIAALALVLNPSLAAYTFDDDNKLLVDMGLSTLFLAGLLLAAFTATGVLTDELENKTALTVVSKPVARPLLVLGKYAGVGAAIIVAFWILTCIFLLTVRHRVMQTAADTFDGPVLLFGCGAGLAGVIGAAWANYFYRSAFTSTLVAALAALMTLAWAMVMLIDEDWQFQDPTTDLNQPMMVGLFLILQAVLILTALAIAASTRLGRMATLVVCAIGFGAGILNDYFSNNITDQYGIIKVLCLGVPNLQFFWPADVLTQGLYYPTSYVLSVTGYTVMYITALMALAVALFQKREVG